MQLKVDKIQNNSNMCVVCGLDNPFSLKAHFYQAEGGVLIGVCQPLDVHQSYPNRMHGGMICALLDETIGRAVQIDKPDDWGVTSHLSMKYRKPVPLNKTIYCVGKVIKDSSRAFVAKGFIEDQDGVLLAECEATYFKAPVRVIAQGGLDHTEWFLDENAEKYDSIDLKNMDFFDREN